MHKYSKSTSFKLRRTKSGLCHAEARPNLAVALASFGVAKAGPRGIEPRSSLLEREILPLNYRPIALFIPFWVRFCNKSYAPLLISQHRGELISEYEYLESFPKDNSKEYRNNDTQKGKNEHIALFYHKRPG